MRPRRCLTAPRGYDDWSVILVDRLLRVENDHVPPDLVHVGEAGIAGGGFMRTVAIDDLRDMAVAAAAAGAPIGVWSGYRSYDEQVQIFTGYANQFGFEDAILYSQRPGHSEHQLGLGVDFMTAGGTSPLPGDWATTPAGAWMRDNAWQYGWINSYPLGDPPNLLWNKGACFHYEPWHYRYLGREIAAAVHHSDLTIREYLWHNFTMVDPMTGQPIATPTPGTRPTTAPTPTPSPSPSPTATPLTTSPPTPSPTLASMPANPSVEPSPPAGRWFGLDPGVIASIGLAGLALMLAVIVAADRHTIRP